MSGRMIVPHSNFLITALHNDGARRQLFLAVQFSPRNVTEVLKCFNLQLSQI